MSEIRGFFEDDRKEILKCTDELYGSLTRLHGEGKLYRRKNLRRIQEITQGVSGRLNKHKKFQEQVLFPYLKRHIPKYETRIRFLRSDHKEIKTNIERLRQLLMMFIKTKADLHLEGGPMQVIGIYLVCLLRNHVQLEEEGIHKAFKKDLRRNERKEIEEKTRNWFDDATSISQRACK